MTHVTQASHASPQGTAIGAEAGTWTILCRTITLKPAARATEKIMGTDSSTTASNGTTTDGSLDGMGKNAIALTSSQNMNVLKGSRQRVKIVMH